MQNYFQIISNYLYTITKNVSIQSYIKFNLHSVSGFLLILSSIIVVTSLLLLGFCVFKSDYFGDGFPSVLLVFMICALLMGLFSALSATSTPNVMTVKHPQLVKKDTRKLTDAYKNAIYINLNDDKHNYLYFTNDENKANDIKNNLASNGTSVTLGSNSKDTLVCLDYDTDDSTNSLKSYKFIKTPVQLNGSNNNSVKVYNTNKMPIKKIISNNTSVETTDNSDDGQDLLNTWFVFHMLTH